MTPYIRLILASIAAAVLAGCAVKPVEVDYTAYKQSRPRSILVLPPTNQSPDVGAGQSVLSVTTQPLAEAGYYVMPVTLVNETFKQNGVTVAEDAQAIPAAKLREIFGADAGLYLNITRYGAHFQVFSSVVEVAADARLVDLRNGTELWKGHVLASDNGGNNNNSGGLLGALIGAAISQAINNVADASHGMAGVATGRLLTPTQGGLLYGPYNPKYGTD